LQVKQIENKKDDKNSECQDNHFAGIYVCDHQLVKIVGEYHLGEKAIHVIDPMVIYFKILQNVATAVQRNL
jgi:hypothetical protein